MLLAALVACSSSSSGGRGGPTVQDIALLDAPRDLAAWEAWSLDVENSIVAVAPMFGRPGVTIDLRSGQVRQSGDEALFDSDKPLWFDHGTGQCSDGVSTQVTCSNATGLRREAAALARLAPGAIALLGRDDDGHVMLTAWSGTAAAWSYSPAPVADAGGVAVASDGLAVALVAARDAGPASITLLDPATGAVRWSVETELRFRTWPALFQPIAFADADRKLLVAGRSSDNDTIVALDAKDGSTLDTFIVDEALSPSSDNLHASFGLGRGGVWTMEVRHVGRPSHPLGDVVQDHWECTYRAYGKGQRRAVVDTTRREAAYAAMFGKDPQDCDVRVARPLRDGGLVTVSLTEGGLRIRRWQQPPGAP